MLLLGLLLSVLGGCSGRHVARPQPPRLEPEQTERLAAHIARIGEHIDRLDALRRCFYSDEVVEVMRGIASFEEIDQDEGSWRFVYIDPAGARWFVAEGVWMEDQFGPDGPPWEMRTFTLWKEGAEDLVHEQVRIQAVQQDPVGMLAGTVVLAQSNFEQQERYRRKVERLDLPRDRSIVHLALVPRDHADDVVLATMVDDVEVFPLLLIDRGYPVVATPLIETVSPEEDLREAIARHHDAGSRAFYIDLVAHGIEADYEGDLPGGMVYAWDGSDAALLDGGELTGMLGAFPDATFLVNTIACHGGGYREQFQSAALPNATIVLQSKPYQYNEEGRLSDGEADSSYFGLFFHHALARLGTGEALALPGGGDLRIDTLGDAIRYADLRTGEFMYCDAEVVHVRGMCTLSGQSSAGSFPEPPVEPSE